MCDSSNSVARAAPPFLKGGVGGIFTVPPEATVAKSPLTPLYKRGEQNHRAFGA